MAFKLAFCIKSGLVLFVYLSSMTDAQCPPDRGPLTVWLDDATNCQADEKHCERFGMEFVCSEEISDPHPNATCQTGVKALCSYPPIPRPLVETPATTFKTLAYNVWELRYLYYQIGQRERTCRIIPEVIRRHPDLDAIIFNEAFMGGCIGGFNLSYSGEKLTFRDILKEYGFGYATATIGNPPTLRKFENGGIFIASKWPIVDEDNVIYEATQPLTADDLSQKGAAYAKVLKTVDSVTRVYHVLGTHLQATDNVGSDNVRRNQAREMHELMLSKNIPPHEPVVYGGDLNADRLSDLGSDIFGILDASMPEIVGEQQYTKDKTINDIYDSGSSQKWIDYVLYSNAHLQPTSATTQVVIPKAVERFGVCLDEVRVWPRPLYSDNSRCRTTKNITDLADHFAVLGSFDYPADVQIVTTLPPSKIPTQSASPTTTINPEDKCPQRFTDLSVWVDDAPDCHANESYCSYYGLNYVCKESFQDNSGNATCPSGIRVRCSFPPSTIELVDTPVTTLKVLSYNIWELGYLYYQNGQRERTCRTVPKVLSLHPDLDVIVFQEVFMGGCFSPLASLNRLTIREILTEYGFSYFTGTVGIPRSNPVKLENGGTFIASKWPILEESQQVFRDGDRASVDVLMAKGVMYAKIEKTVDDVSKLYHVFGTHYQSGSYNIQDTIRMMQAVEMYEFQKSFNIPVDEPVIYAGDLNADRINKPQHAADVIGALRSSMPRIVGDVEYTFDAGTNDVFWDIISVRLWLDYVLYSNEHEQPVISTIEVVRPKAEAPMEVCLLAPLARAPVYADSQRCWRSRVITNLADHYAVLGVLDYDQSKRTTTRTEEPPASTPIEGMANVPPSLSTAVLLCVCLVNMLL